MQTPAPRDAGLHSLGFTDITNLNEGPRLAEIFKERLESMRLHAIYVRTPEEGAEMTVLYDPVTKKVWASLTFVELTDDLCPAVNISHKMQTILAFCNQGRVVFVLL